MTWRRAVSHLRRADPTLAGVIDGVGACRFRPRTDGTHFDALVRSIVYQQLSGKAAATIHARLLAHFGGRHPAPADVLAAEPEALRAAGLSRQKLGYLRDLAAKAQAGVLPVEALHELNDEEITRTLVAVKGIGRWTAQMFLIFRLGRPDVLPTGDLGIQNAIRRVYRLRSRPDPAKTERIAEPWRPHRTVACWYLWRVLD